MGAYPEFSRIAAQVFVSGLWQGCVVAAAVALGLRLLPAVSASARFAIWIVTFACVAGLPFVRFGGQTRGGAPVASMVHAGPVWAAAIGVVWALLMVVRAAELIRQAGRLRRVWRRAEPVPVDPELASLLEGGGRAAVLCVSADVQSPGVIGFSSPRLLIPQSLYAALTSDQLRQIVLHECAHLRRRDDWMNLLQKLALVIFPLNPALFWVDRRLAFEREMACDASVIARTAAPLAYARCLAELAEHRLGHQHLALLLPAWSRPSELSRRVHCLLRPMSAISPLQVRASAVLLCLCLTGTAVEVARAPRLVSFSSEVGTGIEVASAQRPTLSLASPVAFQAIKGAPPVRAQLVSASMPHPAAQRPGVQRLVRTSMRAHPRIRSQLVLANSVPASRAQQVFGIVQFARRPAPALTQVSTYAAVPFGDGWLIVQL